MSISNKRSQLFVATFHNPVTAWVVLGVSLSLTIVAYFVAESFVQQRARDNFDFRAEEITHAIEDRLHVYEQALWGVVGLMNASEEVNREEFKLYVDTLNINQYWPGIQGIGFSIPLQPAEIDEHVNSIRAQGFPDYRITPETERDEYTTIIYLEPFDWRNQRAFGYDMWSNELRREAMTRARDQGVAATSGLITLVQETEDDQQAGFLTYLPLYSSATIPTNLQTRRQQFAGWVYAPFRAGNLMRDIVGSEDTNIEFEIYDGGQVMTPALLYDSNQNINGTDTNFNPHFSRLVDVELQGRPWLLYFHSPNNFRAAGSEQPLYIATAGFIVDILLFYLIYSLYILNKRNETLGNEWRQIIEQAPNALITVNGEGGIVMTNAQADELFGYERDELLGQSINQLVPNKIRQQHPALMRNFLGQPQARAMGLGRDLTAQRKDNSEIPVEIGLNPLKTQQGDFVLAAVVDISERQRVQQRLEHINTQLQHKNKEMEQFIYTVSHDLRSPLVTIAGFAKLLRDEMNTEITDKQAHQINRIEANINHMETLLNDLLQLSRVIHQDLQKKMINMPKLVQDTLDRLGDSVSAADIRINIAENLPMVYGNESLVFQCLQNLLSNAIQYRDTNRALHINIKGEDIVDACRIEIADNGIGIEEEYFATIFRIFERLGIGQGTGVGLSIVKTIMEKHGGTVELSSTPDVGSTFTLIFPK